MEDELIYVQGHNSQLNRVFVMWKLTDFCNFKCSYCELQQRVHGEKYQPSLDTIKKAIDTLSESYPNVQIQISFSGGEPTTHKNFREILEYAKSKEIWCAFLSNGSRGLSFYESLIPFISNNGIELTHHVEDGNLEKFLELSLLYKKHNKLLTVKVPHLPTRWDECRSAYLRLKDTGIPVLSKFLFKEFRSLSDGDNQLQDYSDEQRQQLNSDTNHYRASTQVRYSSGAVEFTSPTRLIGNGINKFRGWTCFVGLDVLVVGVSGNVQKGACNQDGSIGNLFEGTFKKPTLPTICQKDTCWCLSDIHALKYKNYVYNAKK